MAINEAYRIENEVAKYPRICLSRAAVSKLNDMGFFETTQPISRDEDGVWSINVINFMLGLIMFEHPDAPPEEDLNRIKIELDKAHEKLVDSPDKFQKIDWLCDVWDLNFEHPNSPFDRNFRTNSGQKKSFVDTFNEALS